MHSITEPHTGHYKCAVFVTYKHMAGTQKRPQCLLAIALCCHPTDTQTLRVPKVHHVGAMPNGRGSFIIMEHMDFSGSPGQEELGRRLAQMHKAQPKASSNSSLPGQAI